MEGVGHGSADEQCVHLAHQVSDYANLVGNLGATQNCDERALRIPQSLSEIIKLLLHQESRGGFADKLRNPSGRCMRAVCGAEGVIHIKIGELRKRSSEAFVVCFFFGMETQILEQQSLPALQPSREFFRLDSNTIRREAYVTAALQQVVE